MRNRPVVVQPGGELLLVIRSNRRVLLGDEQPQPDRGRHLAVREVMHDFPGAPLVSRWPRVELPVRSTCERIGHLAIPIFVSGDEMRSSLMIHHVNTARMVCVRRGSAHGRAPSFQKSRAMGGPPRSAAEARSRRREYRKAAWSARIRTAAAAIRISQDPARGFP